MLLVFGLAVGTSDAVPEGEVLAIVVVEVKMVDGVMGGRIDDIGVELVFAVVDQDRPQVDGAKHAQVDVLLHGYAEDKDMVRNRLEVAVQEVESVGGVWCRDDPLVVGLINKKHGCRALVCGNKQNGWLLQSV